MNKDLILDRLTNNIIDYTIKTREKVYNNVREEMVNYYWNVGRMISKKSKEETLLQNMGENYIQNQQKDLQRKWEKVFHVPTYSI